MEQHERFMKEALAEANRALARDEVPIGAVVVCDGKIIARAHNLTETLNDPTAHAEMQAITMATNAFGGKYLERATIYVTIEPCPMCAAALGWAQMKCVVYGAADPKRGFTLFSPSLLHPKCDVVSGIMENECGEIVKQFFKSKRS
ncbi:MAG: tRNA-specific adenosine deaminase [Bacteroidetes bacterium HGW-Bacteroidetes-7]|nr:MAG: tRNA-specific adenosine deaminase [Bacteroidetes bacterium HGW-Bacteroidetes-7]